MSPANDGELQSTGRETWVSRMLPPAASGVDDDRSAVVAQTAVRAAGSYRSEQVRLALRIVLHLDRAGPLDAGDVATVESTQAGMTARLGVTQGAISKVLRQLVAAEVVRLGRHHVRGEARRLRAYSLTWRGAEIARRYRERFGGTSPPREGTERTSHSLDAPTERPR